MPELNKVPAPVPAVLSRPLASVVADQSSRFDISIGDIPFLLWPSEDDPYVRDLQQDQKDQFDSSGEAGENSFGQWWLRSQSTFHAGAGQKFLDSTGSQVQRQRFWSSDQVHVHTAGEVTLAPWIATPAPPPADVFGIEQVVWATETKLVYAFTGTNQLTVRDPLANLPLDQNVTVGVGSIAAFTSDGARVFVAVGGSIYRVDSGAPATVTQTHSNLTFDGPVKLGFAKDRLICTIGPRVYELAPAPGAPVDMTAAVPHHTVQASGWQFTSIADGPNGIYLAGYAGPNAQLLSMTVTDTAGALDLGPPVVQLSMPPAEIINDVFFYVNSFFVLATSSGARVGSFTPYGQPQMGPLCIDEEACYALSATGAHVWAAAESGVWRIDLATQIDESGRYAHALMDTPGFLGGSDQLNSITVIPGAVEKAYGSFTDGTMYYTGDSYNVPGVLTTSWIRFDTVEPKELHYVRVDGDFPVIPGVTNPCTVTVETDSGDTQVFNITGGKSTYEFTTASLSPAQQFRLTFTLNDAAIGGSGLTLRSYQLKALPSVRLFGEHIVPLACFDSERDREGKELGYKGFAADRLLALEDVVDNNLRVTVADRMTGESFQAVVKRFQFRQVAKPARGGRLGGVVSLVLRKV